MCRYIPTQTITSILMMSLLLLGTLAAQASECLDYSQFSWDPFGSASAPGSAYDVVSLDGGRVVGGFDFGLGILDFQDNANPSLQWIHQSESPVLMVCADETRLAAILAGGEILVFDLTGDENPVFLTSINQTGNVFGASLVQGKLALALEVGGLQVYDLESPGYNQLYGGLDIGYAMLDVFLVNDLALVSTSGGLMALIDIAIEDDFELTGEYYLPYGYYAGLAVTGNEERAYLAVNVASYYQKDLIAEVNITDPGNPQNISYLKVPGASSIHDLVLDGTNLVASQNGGGFHLFDLEISKFRAAVLSDFQIGGASTSDDMVFVAQMNGTVTAFNIADLSAAPFESSDEYISDGVFALHGDYLYVAVNENLLTYSLAGIRGPQLLSTLPVIGLAKTLVVDGNRLFMGTDQVELSVLDLSNPALPMYLGTRSDGRLVYDMAVRGDKVYLITSGKGLLRYDVSNPSDIGFFDLGITLPARATSMAFSGDQIVVNQELGQGAVLQIDHSDPDAFVMKGIEFLDDFYWHVEAGNGVAYTLGVNSQLHILDLKSDQSPQLLKTLDLGGEANNIKIEGRYMYVLDYRKGVRILDCLDPQNPTALGCGLVPLGGSHRSLALDESRLVTIDTYGDLVITPAACGALAPVTETPAQLRLSLQAIPNPFNPQTNIQFELAVDSSVQLSIYDVSGRQIRQLVQGATYSAGPQSVLWDGRNDQGRSVPSGVYFSRIEADGVTATGKLALIR